MMVVNVDDSLLYESTLKAEGCREPLAAQPPVILPGR
jgi:hypothetical protein